MLIDRFLPEYHFNEVHTITINANPDRVYSAIKGVKAGDIPLFRELMGLRSVPALLMRKHRHTEVRRTDHTLLEDVLGSGTFITLADEPEQEFVVGSIGKFWQVSGGLVKLKGPSDYSSDAHNGYAKTAMNFRIYRNRSTNAIRVRTETRILVPDKGSRRKFAAYWLLIRPGSALIRRMWLGAIKKRAEA